MSVEPPTPPAAFSEREFYLREFRGRTLAVAVPAEAEERLARIAAVRATLAHGGARVLLLSPDRAALEKALGGEVLPAEASSLESAAWRRLRAAGSAGMAVPGAGDADFAAACRRLAARLGLFKLAWLDARGGLRDAAGRRRSFVNLEELRALLGEEGAGLATREREPLWREVAAMLEAGVPAVNVCSPAGLDEELFTYAGSGTLFTRERYVAVRRLALDDFDAAHDLFQRGVEEGFLAPREAEQVDAVLAHGFGAFVEGRYLAGIGALVPGGDGRSGEIASLYTLTRFKGEGVGGHLVAAALRYAREKGLAYVYACTTSEAVGSFFRRSGFRAVDCASLPEAKWRGYDAERLGRLRCYRREVGGAEAAGEA